MPGGSVLILSAPSQMYLQICHKKVNSLNKCQIHYIIRLFLSLCTPFSTNDDIYYICNNTNLHVSFVCILQLCVFLHVNYYEVFFNDKHIVLY